MKLADFISQQSALILADWVSFAETCGAAGSAMDLGELRDHAAALLVDIVTDLRTAQTAAEQSAKSKGDAPANTTGEETAAELHGTGRAASGFSMTEMVAEFRALRASVLRLWIADSGTLTGGDLLDLMRFNEAIDQALAESVSRFADELARSREMFVAILGHDLRNPLNTILMASQGMLGTGLLSAPHAAMTERIVRSATRMNGMTDDLLDFARSRLGTGIPIDRKRTDLLQVAALALEEIRIAHPSHTVQLDSTGELVGDWDGARLRQLLSNLLGNAAQYSPTGSQIRVTLSGSADVATLLVHNSGATIPIEQLPALFDPFTRGAAGRKDFQNDAGLGLGLYIVAQVVNAHGGTINVTSSASDGTTFAISLPRDASE